MIHTLLHWLFVIGYNACALLGLTCAAWFIATLIVAYQNVAMQKRSEEANEEGRRRFVVVPRWTAGRSA